MSFVISQEYLDKLQEYKDIEGIYLANSLQQGFIYHALNQGEIDDAYIVQIMWQYNTSLDIVKLKEAWCYAQKKYPALRLRLVWEEELLQVIDKEGVLDWRYIDLSIEQDAQLQKLKIKKVQEKDRDKSYRLEEGSLFRIYLIKQREDLYTCLFSNHHAILDGWSSFILLDYVHEVYLKLKANEKITLLIDNSYKDAQRYLQEHRNVNKHYWEKYLIPIKEVGDLSALVSISNKHIKVRKHKFVKEPNEQIFTIRGNFYNQLKEFGKNKGITLNAILQCVWHIVLSVYGNNKQTIIGVTVSGRNLPVNDIENSVGLYINTLPLLVNHKIYQSRSVIELIRDIQDNINEINSRSVISLATLQERGERLFDNLFIYENYPSSNNQELNNRLRISFNGGNEKLDYPLAVMAYEVNNELTFKLKYAGELFDKNSIEYLLCLTQELLKQVIINPNQQVKNLSYLTEVQYKEVIQLWNQTNAKYPEDKTIHELFEEQVRETPDNIAVVYDGIELTYKELDEKVNQLAWYLQKSNNIRSGALIALCLDRSEHMIISILTILKIGGAYVPIDPSYHDERIEYILGDTATTLILTNRKYKNRLERLNVINNNNNRTTILAIDDHILQQKLATSFSISPSIALKSTNLAYVIYTSGTTGNPKGVMIDHKAYIATVDCVKSLYFPKDQQIKTYSTTNYVFDIFGLEYGLPLLSGGTLSIGNSDFTSLDCKDFDFVQMTPSLCDLKLDYLTNITSTKLIIGGESLSYSLLKRILSKSINIINAYGPTETTIWSISSLYSKEDIPLYVSLGTPFYNEKTYVLSDNLNPMPIGAIGELYIGGLGLARGYLNRPDLTAERFIANPFQTEEEELQSKNTRLYKTGDLVRWLSDGTLEYIGRNDFQVKIRGYRLELGEIETVLSTYPGIVRSVVIAKEHSNIDGVVTGNKYLVGYYVSATKLEEDDILDYLRAKLPDYMVPTALVHIEQLPLTINGKLDRKALPDPELTNEDSYVAPRNETEKKVCAIWAEVLGLPEDKVSIHDDFFRLGGNSILAIKLVSKLNKALDNNISVSLIFNHNTIAKLTHHLKYHIGDNIVITKANVTSETDQTLSFAQERLWFIEKYEEGTSAYNTPMVFKLRSNIRLDILENSIKSIVTRHESLRTLIKQDNESNSYQLILDDKECPFNITKLKVRTQLQLDQELNRAVNYIYDLSTEYPIKVCLYSLSKADMEEEYYLSIVIHHIAFDGWSIDIFLKELYAYYNYYLEESQGVYSNLNLPELSIQYKDFAIWQRNYLSGERLDKQLAYWKDKLKGYEILNLTPDYPRPTQIDYKGRDTYFELDAAISLSLRELAKELGVSLHSLLLAGYYLMLRSYSNQDDIVVGIPIANRHYSQIENLIGLFINSLALRTKINPASLVKEFIQTIGKEVIEAQLYQDLPFEKLVEELKVAKDTSRHPIFQIMFSVQSFGIEMFSEEVNEAGKGVNTLLQSYKTEASLYNIAKFDISTLIDDSQTCLRGSFNYATSLYEETTIKRFIETYTEILRQLAALAGNKQKQEQIRVTNLSYLTEVQYKEVIQLWNQTNAKYPEDKTIHELFEEQVREIPDNIAVVYDGIELTYKELDEKVNQLAWYLQKSNNIRSGALIALCLDRSEHMIISILTILKIGGAYVPIDPSYHDERIEYILGDTATTLILTNRKYKNRLERLNVINNNNNRTTILAIDDHILQQKLATSFSISPSIALKSTNLAYVIYTSGTTGNPKGVMIDHKAYIATVDCVKSLYFPKDQQIKTYSTTNYVFDIFGLEYGLPLLSGGTLSIGNSDFTSLDCKDFDFVQMTPSLCDLKLDYLTNITSTKLIIGGESLSYSLLKRILSKSINIINAYGPTETTIWSISSLYSKEDIPLYVSLGTPFYNEKTYVLSDNLNPMPIGAIGELYIGGLGLARGYLNRPDLTAERFIANPFQTEEEELQSKNTRLYKTGDLVRWLSDGTLEYIGRNDFQVKIRGYRLELGEIETVLSTYPGIVRSVVIAKEHSNIDGVVTGNKYLVGYYVSATKLEEDDILDYLRAKLPDYMVPTALVHIEQLPLTINGKLDRKALPDPELTNEDSYVAPRNETEKKVCAIWAEVLGLPEDKVSIHDDFFRLGGNSILAIKLVSKLNKELSSQISVKDIFEIKSVSKILELGIFNISCDEPELYVPFSVVNREI